MRDCLLAARGEISAPRCFYCDAPLSSRHEHDHFPVPKRWGGTQTYCTCINCHDLKDRIPMAEWGGAGEGVEMLKATVGLMAKATPMERILLAKLMCMALDGVGGIQGTEERAGAPTSVNPAGHQGVTSGGGTPQASPC